MVDIKTSLVILTPEGEKTYEIWDSLDLEDTFLELGRERLTDSSTFFTDEELVNQLQHAVENDLGKTVYELFLTARDVGEPYFEFEFVDNEGHGEGTYEDLLQYWADEEG